MLNTRENGKALNRVTQDIEQRMRNLSSWPYLPENFVNDLFSPRWHSRYESYNLETGIRTFLLFIWALWPSSRSFPERNILSVSDNDRNLQRFMDIARCVGALLTFSRIDGETAEETHILCEPIETENELSEQIMGPWYKIFRRDFLAPIGGLLQHILEGRNANYYDELIREHWKDTLLARDIAKYYCCAARMSPRLATPQFMLASIQDDIFGRGDYRQPGLGARERKISESKVSNVVQKGLPSALLLYAIERKFPEITRLTLSDSLFPAELGRFHYQDNRMRDALLYFKRLQTIVGPLTRKVPSLERWGILDVKAKIPKSIVEEVNAREIFSEVERDRLYISCKYTPGS